MSARLSLLRPSEFRTAHAEKMLCVQLIFWLGVAASAQAPAAGLMSAAGGLIATTPRTRSPKYVRAMFARTPWGPPGQ